MNKNRKPLLLLAGMILNLVLGILFLLIWYQRSRLPYNESGRYFDGETVLLTDAVDVYGLTALFFFILFIIFALIFIKRPKQP